MDINFIIGMPPGDHHKDTNTVIQNSMPLAYIYPGAPSFTKGLTLFTRKDTFNVSTKDVPAYTKQLSDHGFTLKQPGVQKGVAVAYLADSFPSDSFTNEYGENFLQKFTNVASEGMASLSQMLGAKSVGGGAKTVANALAAQGGIVGKIGEGLGEAGKTVGNIINALGKAGGISSGLNLASRLAAGARIDFPMIWKSSGFQPSYTMTIRLYNPEPKSEESTKKYIIGPIAALMLLAIPMSADGSTYTWPYIHRIVSPGIYDLDPAFISNITIIKGGDQQQISYKQSLGIVDVRIDFGSLFSSMLAAKSINKTRPTLQSYIDGMLGQSPSKSSVKFFSSVGSSKAEIEENRKKENFVKTAEIKIKNQAPVQTEQSSEEVTNPSPRVSQTKQNVQSAMEQQLPELYV